MEQIAECWKMERKRWAFSEENLFRHTENTPADVLKNWCLPLFCLQCHLHPQKLAGDELRLGNSNPQWFWEISGWQLRFLKLNEGNFKSDVSKVWTLTTLNTTDLFRLNVKGKNTAIGLLLSKQTTLPVIYTYCYKAPQGHEVKIKYWCGNRSELEWISKLCAWINKQCAQGFAHLAFRIIIKWQFLDKKC